MKLAECQKQTHYPTDKGMRDQHHVIGRPVSNRGHRGYADLQSQPLHSPHHGVLWQVTKRTNVIHELNHALFQP